MITIRKYRVQDMESAYQLDFNTTNYFTRYVKRVLGLTPSQYKAKFSVKK